MTYEVGDIVELCDFSTLLWEVTESAFFERVGAFDVPNIRVRFWACPPNVDVSDVALERLKVVDTKQTYRVECRSVRRPANAMMVIATSSQNPEVIGRLPFSART